MTKTVVQCSFWCALGCVLLPASAQGAFVGEYAVSNFVFENVQADGTFVTLDGGLSAVLTGGQNGSYSFGTSTASINSAGTGLVRFDYSYESLDYPGFDWAGYVLGGNFTLLTGTSGEFGHVELPVLKGQSFGFRVVTEDNTFEPGILTVRNFAAPNAVPEPRTLPAALGALGAMLYVRKRYLRARAVRSRIR